MDTDGAETVAAEIDETTDASDAMALEGVQSEVTSNVIAPNIVAYLCSEQADYVTGQVIGVTAASTCSVSEAALANGIAARFRRFQ